MSTVKFAQLSDLHLGVRLTASRLRLTPREAATRRDEQRRALTRFVEAALAEQVDVVLLPGDLTHTPKPSEDTVNFLIDTLNRLDPIPTFIAPGNHDYYSADGFYALDAPLYRARRSGAPQWGDHIHIFRSPSFECVPAGAGGRIAVTGCAFAEHVAPERAPLADAPPPAGGGVNLLLLHASLLGAGRMQCDEAQVCPFTVEALAALNYDYAALGHYHGMSVVEADGRVVGAYAGCPAAAGLDETGEKGFLIGAIEPGAPANIEFRQADERQVRRVYLDVTGLPHTTAFDDSLRAKLAEAGANECDMVHVQLSGRYPPGSPFSVPEAVADGYFHFAVDDAGCEPDYDVPLDEALPESPATTVEDRFIRRLQECYRAAASDDERARVYESLYYGLDALRRRKVVLR